MAISVRAFVKAVAESKALPIIWVGLSIAFFAYLYGFYSNAHRWFPSPQVEDARVLIKDTIATLRGKPGLPYIATKESRAVVVNDRGAMEPGLTLLSGVGGKGALFARLIDADGHVLHAWDLDFFRLWPDPSNIPKPVRPKSRPGTHVQGIVLEPNGDLVFSYENMGMMKVDVCGRPIWRVRNRVHHSIEKDDDGNYWAPALDESMKPDPKLPNHQPVITYYSVLEVSPDGRVLKNIPIFDLLQQNGYNGLLYMQSSDVYKSDVTGDMLHVNAVAVFPKSMTEGVFKHGDVMVSLRNINTIIVFDPNTMIIKTAIIGRFVRQHDPDFVDGSTISVFDNNNVTDDDSKGSSRIVNYSVKDGTVNVVYKGTPDHPFFSSNMGKHQELDNGNMLITEAFQGRAFEITPNKRIAWEYFNQTGQHDVLGLLDDAQRISPGFMSESKLKELAATCPRT